MGQIGWMLLQEDHSGAAAGGIIGGFCCVGIIYLAILALIIAGAWKLFVKAGQPGWAAIVPFYNTYVVTVIVGKPILWFILMFIPLVNVVVGILLTVELAKVFGKGVGYAIGMILLPFVFVPMLGFGKAQYTKPPAPAA